MPWIHRRTSGLGFRVCPDPCILRTCQTEGEVSQTSRNSKFEIRNLARQVAHGYRRPIPTWWPPELGALVVECWADDPDGCAANIRFIVTRMRR